MGIPDYYFLLRCLCTLYILLDSSSKSSAICKSSTAGYFVVHPLDQTVKEGQNATFICTAQNLDFTHFELTWNVYPDKYDRETFTSLVRDRHEITSRTIVYRVGKTVQTFKCLMKYLYKGSEKCYHSREAKTNVQFFPKNGQLSCGPSITGGFHEGDKISLRCASPRGNPPVDLRWTFDGYSEEDVAFPMLHGHGLLRILETNLAITRDLHLRKILCQATSFLAFPDQISTCSLGPILVLQEPSVCIYPAEATIEETKEGSISFKCIAKGFPPNFTFDWSCISDGTFHRCESHTDKLDFHLDSNKRTSNKPRVVKIICTVSNSVGLSTNSSTLIIQSPLNNSEICNVSQNNHNKFLHLRVSASELFEHSFEFSCFLVPPLKNVDVEFKLYLGETLLTSARKNITSLSWPLINVTLNNTSDNEKVVFCKVEGVIGINYVIWRTCTVIRVNGEIFHIKKGESYNSTVFSNHSIINRVYASQGNINTTGFINRGEKTYAFGLFPQLLEGTPTNLEEGRDTTRNIYVTDDKYATEITKTSLMHALGHVKILLMGSTVMIILVSAVAAFIFCRQSLEKRSGINAKKTGISADMTSDDCAYEDPFYEMPDAQSDSSTEKIAFQYCKSSSSDSLYSMYSDGYACRLTNSSSTVSSSSCSK